MAIPQEIIDQFNYDKGYCEGAKAVLNLQIGCQPLTSIQDFVQRLEAKFKQLETLIAQARAAEKPKAKVIKKKAAKPKKVKS
jgi:hypothetical protein